MYLTLGKTAKLIGVHRNTILSWKSRNLIDFKTSPTGQILYDVSSYIDNTIVKRRICYCRVSSNHQKDDLQRQIQFLKNSFPDFEIVYDIGSGLNFKRKNFLKIIDDIILSKVETLVVAHKDRLCRFGYDLVKYLADKHNCKIIIVKEEKLSPQEEIVIDLTSIIHSFSTKLYGFRKYKLSQLNT